MENPSPPAVVSIEKLKKTFDGKVVLAGLDLEVRARETVVILGPSGSGKSLTIRHIVKLETPDSGRVLLFGSDLATARGAELERLRLRVGYLFQSGALINWLTVEENAELPLLEHRPGMRAKERRARVMEKLELLGIAHAAGLYPSEISGGMKKRAALARAIMLEPELVLYDEPTSGLDPIVAETINELILDTAERLGTTQIVVTHDLESAFRVADRIALIHGGRILAQGEPAEIKDSSDPTVRRFLGVAGAANS